MHEIDFQVPDVQLVPPLDVAFHHFYLSFAFSQGTISLQMSIFSWLCHSGYAGYVLSRSAPDEIMRGCLLGMSKHPSIPIENRRNEVNKRWLDFCDTLSLMSSKHDSKSGAIASIAMNTAKIDLDYQVGKRIGRTSTTETEPDSRSDPHVSFLRRYALMAVGTGSKEFDKMFREVASYVNNSLRLPTLDIQLKDLASGWERNHPGHQFFPIRC